MYRRYLLRLRAAGTPVIARKVKETLPDKALEEAYIRSNYVLLKPHQVWRVGAATKLRGAVLGAWNPLSAPYDEYRNRRRDQRLLRLLQGFSSQKMWGGTETWWERHYWVPGISQRQARRMACKMEQMAFLYLDGRHVLLARATL